MNHQTPRERVMSTAVRPAWTCIPRHGHIWARAAIIQKRGENTSRCAAIDRSRVRGLYQPLADQGLQDHALLGHGEIRARVDASVRVLDRILSLEAGVQVL